MCSHRLLSLYRDYQAEVFSWLRDVKSGIRDFNDYCAQDPSRIEVCADADLKMQQMLRERGITEDWPGYHATLSDVSKALSRSYPKHIMLDSGAFTAWNTGAPVTLDDVKSVYERFLTAADGLFEEVWLINLDVITEDSSSPETKQAAMQQSDHNLAELRSEFGKCVLPVFHQDEGQERLLEVVDQANGYLCLSPNNKKPEEDRWRWAMLARSALSDLDCSVRTHGLATTGNHMMRNATLYSGDSEAWTRHARYGVVDLIEAETTISECPATHTARTENGNTIEIDRYLQIKEVSNPRYRGYHIGAERNDWNRKTNERVIDNSKHFSHLNAEKRGAVRRRVEQYLPFVVAQFDMRARSIINLGELRALASERNWREPTGPTVTVKIDGQEIDPTPYMGQPVEVRPYPLAESSSRFLAQHRAYAGL